jgi:hypothetical protein
MFDDPRKVGSKPGNRLLHGVALGAHESDARAMVADFERRDIG